MNLQQSLTLNEFLSYRNLAICSDLRNLLGLQLVAVKVEQQLEHWLPFWMSWVWTLQGARLSSSLPFVSFPTTLHGKVENPMSGTSMRHISTYEDEVQKSNPNCVTWGTASSKVPKGLKNQSYIEKIKDEKPSLGFLHFSAMGLFLLLIL